MVISIQLLTPCQLSTCTITTHCVVQIKIEPQVYVIIDLLESFESDTLFPPPPIVKNFLTISCVFHALHSPNRLAPLHYFLASTLEQL